MSVTTYLGIVEQGKIRLCEDVELKDNVQVYVVVPEVNDSSPIRIRTPRLANPQQAKEFVKQVIEAESDADV